MLGGKIMPFGFVKLGVKELVLILFIVLVIFGPRKLPEVGRSIGEMLSNFRSSSKQAELDTEDKQSVSGTNNGSDSE